MECVYEAGRSNHGPFHDSEAGFYQAFYCHIFVAPAVSLISV
jgi:hypothetical protein